MGENIGKVEIKNAENEINGSVKAAYHTLFVGGEVTLDASDILSMDTEFVDASSGATLTILVKNTPK